MNRIRFLAGCLAMALLFASAASGQEKNVGEESASATQLKLQLVLNEMDGSKRVGSFPYVLRVPAAEKARTTSLRLGLRVPIAASGKDGTAQIQYLDVGTNIDCTAQPQADGRYKLWLIVERSSVYTLGPAEKPAEWAPGEQVPGAQPVFRQFRESFDLLLRDGQTIQAMFATDPLTGHTLTVDVTVSAEK